MKKSLFAVVLVLAFGSGLSVARAEMEKEMMDGYCPMMSLMHSKELGLSKKQEAKIKEIKERMWEQMKPIAQKASSETEEVLNPKQEAKYKELASSMSMGGGCCGKDKKDKEGGCCSKHKDGGSCDMKDGKKDKDDDHEKHHSE